MEEYPIIMNRKTAYEIIKINELVNNKRGFNLIIKLALATVPEGFCATNGFIFDFVSELIENANKDDRVRCISNLYNLAKKEEIKKVDIKNDGIKVYGVYHKGASKAYMLNSDTIADLSRLLLSKSPDIPLGVEQLKLLRGESDASYQVYLEEVLKARSFLQGGGSETDKNCHKLEREYDILLSEKEELLEIMQKIRFFSSDNDGDIKMLKYSIKKINLLATNIV